MPIELPQWLEQLRRAEITERVRNDPRSIGSTRLGVTPYVATREVVGGGQADFDTPWENLSPEDRVLLYAYFNQKGHLEELTEAFRRLFADSRPHNSVVVDLGCGPFTGGLAFAGVLGKEAGFDYIGVDQSGTMRRFGEQLAVAASHFDEVPRIVRCWSADIPSVDWKSAPGWRPVIVIVSYLLASPTLDATALIDELEGLLEKLGRDSVTVLYTNSPRPDPNRNYPGFCAALQGAGFELYADDTGEIQINRRNGAITRPVRYALFHRPRQGTLQLGGN